MLFASPLPTGPHSDSASSGSSSISSLFAGDSQSSNSTDITPPRSPAAEEPKSSKLISFTVAGTPHRISLTKLKLPPKTNENEQASCLDDDSTPKTPIHSAKTGIFQFSPLLHIQLQVDDAGYESEAEDEGSPRSPLPKRYSPAWDNPSSLPARMRGVTAPIVPAAGEDPLSQSCVKHVLPVILRQNRPSTIDLTVIPPYGLKPKLGKASIGLGLGLPSNHPLQTSRALTEPVLMSPPISYAFTTNLLPCRPFPPPSPRSGEIQNINPRLRPTVIPGSPSPIEMLPSRFSYFQGQNCRGPLPSSRLTNSPPRNVTPETLRLQPIFVSGIPSPMELYSSFVYDTAYPRTPFVSPEAHASPSFGASDGDANGGHVQPVA
jgi:hypothetical protein